MYKEIHPFVGKYFSNKDTISIIMYKATSHWYAIPLTADEFEIKELNDGMDFNRTFADIIKLFAKTINIETEIIVNESLL